MRKILAYGLVLLAFASCKKSSTDLDRESSIQDWKDAELSIPSNNEIVKAEVVEDKLYILHEKGFMHIDANFVVKSNVSFGYTNPVMKDPRPVFTGDFFAFAKQSDDSVNIHEVLVYNIHMPSETALELDTYIANADLPKGCEVCAISSSKMVLNFQDKATQQNKLYTYRLETPKIIFDKVMSASTEDGDTLGFLKKLYSINRAFYMSDSEQTIRMSNNYEFNKTFDGTMYDVPYEFKDSIYVSTIDKKYMSDDDGYTWKQNLKNIEMLIYPLKITYFELYYRNFESDQLCDEKDVIYKTYDLDNSIPFVPNNNNECYTVLGVMGNKLVSMKDNNIYYIELVEE